MNDDELDEQMRMRVAENMERAFFDAVATDISNNSFDSSFSLLTEIKERICGLVPTRRDIHDDLDENIDVDFYRQMQSNGALDIKTIQAIMDYVIEKIKAFGSLEDEPWNEIWKIQILVRIDRGEPLNTLLPSFFKEAMHRIDKIEEEITAFRESDIYKYITERRNESKASAEDAKN